MSEQMINPPNDSDIVALFLRNVESRSNGSTEVGNLATPLSQASWGDVSVTLEYFTPRFPGVAGGINDMYERVLIRKHHD